MPSIGQLADVDDTAERLSALGTKVQVAMKRIFNDVTARGIANHTSDPLTNQTIGLGTILPIIMGSTRLSEGTTGSYMTLPRRRHMARDMVHHRCSAHREMTASLRIYNRL